MEIKHSVLMKGFSTMSMPQEAEGTRPDMKVKLKSFLSGKWGAGSRRLSAQHFPTLKIDFNFPFIFLVYGGRFSVHEVGGSSTVYSSPLMTRETRNHHLPPMTPSITKV